MVYTSSRSSLSSYNEVYDDSFCSKSCRKNTKNLNKKIIKLNEELSDCETDLYNYKRGLSQVEARLVGFKNNEIKFYERIRVLERDLELRDNKIENLRNELEDVKKEKDSLDVKIKNFENFAKDLDCLLGTQRSVKDKTGLGLNEYTVVPPPPAQVYSPPKNDLSWTGFPEFVDDTITDYSRPTPSIDVPRDSRKPTVKYAEMYRSQRPRGNQRNWNNHKSHQLGSDFVMNNKACFACGSFNHLIKDYKRKVQKPIWNNVIRVNHHNSHRMYYPHPKRNFVPKAVLIKTGMRLVNAAKPKAAYNVVKRNRFNDVKASTCWIWMPKNRVIDHMDAQTQGRHEHDQEFDAEITTVGAEVDDIAAET
ncbi:hypothetical protein Tco_1352426 [Tanacetum coccineum]